MVSDVDATVRFDLMSRDNDLCLVMNTSIAFSGVLVTSTHDKYSQAQVFMPEYSCDYKSSSQNTTSTCGLVVAHPMKLFLFCFDLVVLYSLGYRLY